MKVVKVNEVFDSVNGEVCGSGQGSVCRFIRLSGCNMKCPYCDTKHESVQFTRALDDLVNDFIYDGPRNVTITGGEPLIQLDHSDLLYIIDRSEGSKNISVETNGSIRMKTDRLYNLFYIADYKLHQRPPFSNFIDLRPCDYVKFVCKNWEELLSAVDVMKEMRQLDMEMSFAVSPVLRTPITMDTLTKINEFADRVIANKFCRNEGVLLNIQIHKIFGGR